MRKGPFPEPVCGWVVGCFAIDVDRITHVTRSLT